MKAVTSVSVRSIQLRAMRIASEFRGRCQTARGGNDDVNSRSRGVEAPESCSPWPPSRVGGRREDRELARPMAPAGKMHGAGTSDSAETSRPSLRDARGPAVLPPFPPQYAPASDTASASGCQGPHDFAVRAALFVCVSSYEHDLVGKLWRNARHHLRFRIMLHAATSTRPPRPAPNVRNDRETSLSIGTRRGREEHCF